MEPKVNSAVSARICFEPAFVIVIIGKMKITVSSNMLVAAKATNVVRESCTLPKPVPQHLAGGVCERSQKPVTGKHGNQPMKNQKNAHRLVNTVSTMHI